MKIALFDSLVQKRHRRSGWSGLGRTTFQWVVGLVPRLQHQSEDEMIGLGIPCKLAFAIPQCVPVTFTTPGAPQHDLTIIITLPHDCHELTYIM